MNIQIEDIEMGLPIHYDDLIGKRYLLDKAKKYAERSAQEITYRQDNILTKCIKGI